MPQWEHVQCGTIYRGTAPPIFCEICLGTDNQGLGWRHSGHPVHPDGRAVELPTKRVKKKKKRRKSISRTQRVRIYKRDGYCCVACGFDGRRKPKTLTIDHRIPVVHGGSNSDSNLQTMCFPCNNAKADSIPED